MNSCVLSYGGSVLLSKKTPLSFFKNLKELLEKYTATCQFYLVIGGGKPAREYIQKGRSLGLSETDLDELGIGITQINAQLLSKYLQANTRIPKTIEEATKKKQPLMIMGGINPGHRTD